MTTTTTTTTISKFVAQQEDVSLETLEQRKAYFNENAKPLFGRTWCIFGPNRRLAATGDKRDIVGMFDRFCDWCDSAEAKLPPRKEGMG